jgi:aminoglycoside 2'-N-acetyltransferase I
MGIISSPEADLLPELRAQGEVAASGLASDKPLEVGPTHDPAMHPVSMLLVEDGRVFAALDILSKDITHGGRIYAASGLSTVVTEGLRRPACRSRVRGYRGERR